MSSASSYGFYEFFAGGGMARAGLGGEWKCLFANDFNPKKAASYTANWGEEHFRRGDVRNVTAEELPGQAVLSWASFPCQDLSLAGAGAGLGGERSGTFWPFWELMEQLSAQGRAPHLVVLENVYGALRSHGGADFVAIGEALASSGYRFGAVIVDAAHFVPQSRPRLFVIGALADIPLPERVLRSAPDSAWHPKAVIEAKDKLPRNALNNWVWWNPGPPPGRTSEFSDLIEETPQGVTWHAKETTRRLLAMMTDTNKEKVAQAKKAGRRMVGGVYKRTRYGVQRAEVRFDISGCLRTPVGGSSRQTILVVDGQKVRSRLLSPREAARLMGLPDTYILPENYNEAYHLAGDGVVVPVVRFLAEKILEPVLQEQPQQDNKEAA